MDAMAIKLGFLENSDLLLNGRGGGALSLRSCKLIFVIRIADYGFSFLFIEAIGPFYAIRLRQPGGIVSF